MFGRRCPLVVLIGLDSNPRPDAPKPGYVGEDDGRGGAVDGTVGDDSTPAPAVEERTVGGHSRPTSCDQREHHSAPIGGSIEPGGIAPTRRLDHDVNPHRCLGEVRAGSSVEDTFPAVACRRQHFPVAAVL
jgi:hypothetical protein